MQADSACIEEAGDKDIRFRGAARAAREKR